MHIKEGREQANEKNSVQNLRNFFLFLNKTIFMRVGLNNIKIKNTYLD